MKVSVLIPSFNHAAYIEEAIQSVLSQTFADFELLISDDCSKDGTQKVLQKYEKEPRVRIFYQEHHIGAVEQIHFLIEQASGTYIALLNSDDYWRADKLEKQVEYLEGHPETGACFTQAVFVDEFDNHLSKSDFELSEIFIQPNRTRAQWINYFFYRGNCLCHPSVLARTGIYQGVCRLNPGLRQLPDYDLWTRYVPVHEIFVLQEPLTFYRKIGTENTSAWVSENEGMLLREQAWIRKNMITTLNAHLFIESFREDLRKEAPSGAEILCEKFFLLEKLGRKDRFMRGQAIEFFLEQWQNSAFLDALTKKYAYRDTDFFAYARMESEITANYGPRKVKNAIFQIAKRILKG